MATTTNTFPNIGPDLKDQFGEGTKFSKVKDTLKQKPAMVAKCKHCGKEKCDCPKEIKSP